jgi:hypothetical protein
LSCARAQRAQQKLLQNTPKMAVKLSHYCCTHVTVSHVTGPEFPHLQPETRNWYQNPKPDGLDPTGRITAWMIQSKAKKINYGLQKGSSKKLQPISSC